MGCSQDSMYLLSTLHLSQQELQALLNNCVLSVFHVLFNVHGELHARTPLKKLQHYAVPVNTTITKLPFDTKVLFFATAAQIFWQLFSTNGQVKHEYPVVISVVSLLITNKVLDLAVQPNQIFDFYELLNSSVTEGIPSLTCVETIDRGKLARLVYEIELEALAAIDIRMYTVNHVQQVLSLLFQNISGTELHTARFVLLCILMSPKKLVSECELSKQVRMTTNVLNSFTNHADQFSIISALSNLDVVVLEHLWHILYVMKL
jgi:hypothetical protein